MMRIIAVNDESLAISQQFLQKPGYIDLLENVQRRGTHDTRISWLDLYA